MVFVILLLALVSVLSLGFLNLVRIGSRSGLRTFTYMTAQERARSVHQSVCSRIREGGGTGSGGGETESGSPFGEW